MKAHEVEVNEIKFQDPKVLDNGGKMVFLSYKDRPLKIQTPAMSLPWNMNIDEYEGSAPKHYINVTLKDFETNKEVPYMSEVYNILENKRNDLPGITHVDGTGRLQTVTELNNPKFYKLIKKFYEKTNIPILLNTSFNENEPIVESPIQAIDCFKRTNMDILVLGNWIIFRQ